MKVRVTHDSLGYTLRAYTNNRRDQHPKASMVVTFDGRWVDDPNIKQNIQAVMDEGKAVIARRYVPQGYTVIKEV